MAVCDADEDTLTLAWRAASAALEAAGISADEVSGLWWGTARPPFAEGPSHAFLAATLGLDGAVGGGAAERVAARRHGGAPRRLGRAGGRPLPASRSWSPPTRSCPGSAPPGRRPPGAGAAAVVLGAIAESTDGRSSQRLVTRGAPRGPDHAGHARRRPLPRRRRWRPPATSMTPGCFAKRSSCRCSAETGRAVAAETTTPLRAWAIADPDGKLGLGRGQAPGRPLGSAPVFAALGDTGAAAALLGLIHACADDGSGRPPPA